MRFRVDADKRLAELEAEVAYQSAKKKSPVVEEPVTHEGTSKMLYFWGVVILTLIVAKLPFSEIVFTPLNQFAVMVHEMGHAVATILTGGHVTGMTIVPDGNNHGGLTQSYGGIRFIIAQAGYLGTALVGCLLVWLGQFKRLSRHALVAIGLIMLAGTIFFMGPALVSMNVFQAAGSILWGVVMSGLIIWAGLRLSDRWANLTLLFVAIHTAMDSLRSIGIVITAALMASHISSDATTMQHLTSVPAIIWSLLWAILSIGALGATIWFAYGPGGRRR